MDRILNLLPTRDDAYVLAGVMSYISESCKGRQLTDQERFWIRSWSRLLDLYANYGHPDANTFPLNEEQAVFLERELSWARDHQRAGTLIVEPEDFGIIDQFLYEIGCFNAKVEPQWLRYFGVE